MLRELIEAGLIAPGYVDERSIKDVKADDLEGYTQCHFFAGIGGWSVALRLAGWTDDRPVWTGSCPCQPFSTAGRQKAKQMTATCGQTGSGSSASAALQQSLANKLGQLLPMAGGMMWPMIWKDKTTPLGRQYCQLAVSAHRTRGKDYGLWPSPNCGDVNASRSSTPQEYSARWMARPNHGSQLAHTVQALWATANTMDHLPPRSPEAMERQFSATRKGRTAPANLWEQVQRSMWPKDNGTTQTTLNGLNAQTENQGQLNPAFVSWLMGFHTEHLSCMVLAMRLFRTLRRRSSKRVEGKTNVK